jgi:hypothetical protein
MYLTNVQVAWDSPNTLSAFLLTMRYLIEFNTEERRAH